MKGIAVRWCYTGQIKLSMKSLRILGFCASVLCSSLPLSAMPGIPDYVPVQVHQTDEPVYPTSMMAVGVKSGSASIAVAIDDTGRLTDYLVTAYSHPDFAKSAVDALKKWKFEAAMIHGSPRNSKSDLTFRFQMEGVVVVTMTALSYAEMLHLKLSPGSMAYAACTLGELDHIPNPVKIVNPVYSTDLARSSRGGHVSVGFYIDEQGHVRMPSVSRETNEANEELAAIAVTAVAAWQFDPPMSKGHPVLVVAQQDFHFKATAP
jgi:TonB family protein